MDPVAVISAVDVPKDDQIADSGYDWIKKETAENHNDKLSSSFLYKIMICSYFLFVENQKVRFKLRIF